MGGQKINFFYLKFILVQLFSLKPIALQSVVFSAMLLQLNCDYIFLKTNLLNNLLEKQIIMM